jgi:type I restriction enzyme S subunit
MTLLKDIVQIEKGRKYNLLEEYQEGAIRVFQANDFRNENKPLYTLDADGVLAKEDDIILVWDGSVGQMGFGRSGYVGSTMVKLRVKNKKQFSPFFVYRFLQTKSEYLKRKATGATIMHINRKSLEQLEIPNLEIDDQLHIATFLSKTENLIAQRKESIRLLDEFLKSTFLELFGDPEKNTKNLPFTELEKLCSIIVDCPHSTPVKSKEVTNYPCIRTSELTNGYISWDSMQYLEEDEYIKRTQRLIPEAGDIVYGREGTYGEAIRIPETHRFSLGQRTMLFRPDYTKTNSIFLWAMVRSEFVYRQAKKKNSGSTVGHVNVKDIKQFRIYNPPIELQTQFAKIVEKTEALKTQYQQSLQELENLYGSLSQKAFRGELSINKAVSM